MLFTDIYSEREVNAIAKVGFSIIKRGNILVRPMAFIRLLFTDIKE